MWMYICIVVFVNELVFICLKKWYIWIEKSVENCWKMQWNVDENAQQTRKHCWRKSWVCFVVQFSADKGVDEWGKRLARADRLPGGLVWRLLFWAGNCYYYHSLYSSFLSSAHLFIVGTTMGWLIMVLVCWLVMPSGELRSKSHSKSHCIYTNICQSNQTNPFISINGWNEWGNSGTSQPICEGVRRRTSVREECFVERLGLRKTKC